MIKTGECFYKEEEKELQKIKESINKKEYKLGGIDEFLCDYEDENRMIEKGIEIIPVFVETIDREEHRWYDVETNVYKFYLSTAEEKRIELGYLAITEVGEIKSETMGYEDCFVSLKADNVRKIIKETFEIVK